MNLSLNLDNMLSESHYGIAQRTLLLAWTADNFYCPRSPADAYQWRRRDQFVPKSHTTFGSQRNLDIGIEADFFRVKVNVHSPLDPVDLFFVHRRSGKLFRPRLGRPDKPMYELRSKTEFARAIQGVKRQTSRFVRHSHMPFLYPQFREEEPNEISDVGVEALEPVWRLYSCDIDGDLTTAFESMLSGRGSPIVSMRTRAGGVTPWSSACNGIDRAFLCQHNFFEAVGAFVSYISKMNHIVAGRGETLSWLDRQDPEYFHESDMRQRFRMKCPDHRSFDLERTVRRRMWSRPVIYPDHPIYAGEPREITSGNDGERPSGNRFKTRPFVPSAGFEERRN